MDLRKQEEQILQWLHEDNLVDENEEGTDNSFSETEDIVEEEVHQDTDSCSEVPSESDNENIQPSKRQRTRIIDSDESSDENIINLSVTQNSNISDPRIVQPNARFLYGKNIHKWSSTPRSASTCTLRRNIVHFIPGPKGEARE